MAHDGVHLYSYLGEEIQEALDAIVVSTASNIINVSEPFVLAAVTLYVMVMGWQSLNGQGVPFEAFAKNSARVGLFAGFAGTFAVYDTYIIELFSSLEMMLLEFVVIGGGGAGVPTLTNSYEVLDLVLDSCLTIMKTAQNHISSLGWTSIGAIFEWLIIIILMVLVSVLMTFMGAAIIITAKVAIATLFAIGPVFIICFMFPLTSRFGTLWIAQLVNFIFQVFLVTVYLTFSVKIFFGYADNYIMGAVPIADQVNPILGAVQLLILSLAIYWMLKQTNTFASALSGGIGLAGFSARQMTSRVNAHSTRVDQQTGQQRNDSRMSHILAGNTPLNPKYTSRVVSRLSGGQTWGKWESNGGSVSKSKPTDYSTPSKYRK